jgi:hypothetical protein
MTREAPLHTPDPKQEAPEPLHARLHSAATSLSDADLLSRVVSLARAEREATVELVAHLAELDARKLYLGQGYGSLFSYCTGALRLAEHAAYNRIEVARACREFPTILDLLVDGSLNLATARLLAPHLQPDNFDALVAMASGRSKREVEVLVARLAPRPDVASSVRRLPARVPPAPANTRSGPLDVSTSAAAALECGRTALLEPQDGPARAPSLIAGTSGIRTAGTLGTSASREAFVSRPADRPVVAPLAPARYRVQFTMGEETHEKLRRVQDLLRRDGGQCAFVAAKGRRCAERGFLEFHHQEPYALGGEATVDNISLRCRAHHAYETELAFGPRIASLECEPGGERREPHGERVDSPRGASTPVPSAAHPASERRDRDAERPSGDDEPLVVAR